MVESLASQVANVTVIILVGPEEEVTYPLHGFCDLHYFVGLATLFLSKHCFHFVYFKFLGIFYDHVVGSVSERNFLYLVLNNYFYLMLFKFDQFY
jgi:hypothetical protein